jgi:hypothetical protein
MMCELLPYFDGGGGSVTSTTYFILQGRVVVFVEKMTHRLCGKVLSYCYLLYCCLCVFCFFVLVSTSSESTSV